MDQPKLDQPNAEGIGWTILCTFGTLACHFVAIFAMVLVVISFVREFLHFFQDRDVELAQVTVTIFEVSHAFTNYWYLLVLALPLEGVVYFFLRRTSGKFNWLATVVLVLPLMLVILSLVITMFGLFHPFVELVNADMAAGEV